MTIALRIRASLARRLGVPAAQRLVVVGRNTARLAAPGVAKVRVKLKPKARRALRSARRIPLMIRATATDAAANTRVVERTVTLKP